ncbi:hypothetical protein LTR37_013057 [Vermiconidia calcicola]|uniref:Uncharacterized protein n=1 Tax=Vermiconidia calcicola TaxID=1690605 RepID=A0ACC3MY43_9PEZI|nr:hypothetical protein LTR37_013057 [Vermiconidia calcicola]
MCGRGGLRAAEDCVDRCWFWCFEEGLPPPESGCLCLFSRRLRRAGPSSRSFWAVKLEPSEMSTWESFTQASSDQLRSASALPEDEGGSMQKRKRLDEGYTNASKRTVVKAPNTNPNAG